MSGYRTGFLINGNIQTRKLFDAIEKNEVDRVEKVINKGAWINRRKHIIAVSELVYTNSTP
ncbi:MAG: hypothetical protein IKU52_03975 [Clostridia bacterium]|nr:hypothetical protein [Clostridia bacterium]